MNEELDDELTIDFECMEDEIFRSDDAILFLSVSRFLVMYRNCSYH